MSEKLYTNIDRRDAFLRGANQMAASGMTDLEAVALSLYPDPKILRIVTDLQGNKLELHEDGQVWCTRPTGLFEVLWTKEGVDNLRIVADFLMWPYQTADGVPCTAEGVVKP